MKPVRVKICGLARREDVLGADADGADYLGVVLTAGFARSVPVEEAAALVSGARATTVAVLVDEPVHRACARVEALGAGIVQLHGAEGRAEVEALRGASGARLWKSVRARDVDEVRAVVDALGDLIDGVLVEGWKPGVVGGGGAGLRLDADAVRRAIPPTLDFVLAGGLTAETVADAVARFQPDVVDVSSGVEAALREKDASRVRAFIRAARGPAGAHPPGAGAPVSRGGSA